MFRTLAVAALAGGLAAAISCIPERFGGLTGGPLPDAGPEAAPPSVEDPTVASPRPLSPLSASVITGPKPRFRWQLAPGTVGARLEVCKSRACDGERKTFDVVGSEGTLPDDLAPGIWFWRVYGTTPSTFGNKPSATWEILVRPKAPGAVGDTFLPGRSIVDFDGDGTLDLLAVVDVNVGPDAGQPAVLPFYGRPDGTFISDTFTALFSSGDTRVGAADVDGDGFTDAIMSSGFSGSQQLVSAKGSPKGLNTSSPELLTTPLVSDPPGICELGDVDGDGYGDVGITTRGSAFVLFGTARGLGPVSFFFDTGPFGDAGFPDGGPVLLDSPIPMTGGVIHDDKHPSDFAFSDPFAGTPFVLLFGVADRSFEAISFGAEPSTLPNKIVRLVSGDLDGDGRSDIAFTGTLTTGKVAVCVSLAVDLDSEAQKLHCWEPAAPGPTFGEALAAGDLDEDGKDDVLVGATDGIDVLRFSDALRAEHVATPYSQHLTTIHPGRPGPATWAGVAADGSSVGVFKGLTLGTVLRATDGILRFRRIR